MTVGSGIGINHQSGTLSVENTVVDGWDHGLESQMGASKLFVKGSVFRNNATFGLFVASGSTAMVAIDQSFFENNAGSGIYFSGGTSRVSNTVMTASIFYGAIADGAGAEATLQRCEVSGNVYGLGAFNGAVLRVSESTVTRNTSFGLLNGGGGATLESFGNNVVRGNTTETSGTITTVALQ